MSGSSLSKHCLVCVSSCFKPFAQGTPFVCGSIVNSFVKVHSHRIVCILSLQCLLFVPLLSGSWLKTCCVVCLSLLAGAWLTQYNTCCVALYLCALQRSHICILVYFHFAHGSSLCTLHRVAFLSHWAVCWGESVVYEA